jgi:hypothetical protein
MFMQHVPLQQGHVALFRMEYLYRGLSVPGAVRLCTRIGPQTNWTKKATAWHTAVLRLLPLATPLGVGEVRAADGRGAEPTLAVPRPRAR